MSNEQLINLPTIEYYPTIHELQTTNATPAAICTEALLPNQVYIVKWNVKARAGNNDRAGYFGQSVVYTSASSGDVEGSAINQYESQPLWDAAISVVGLNLVITVTGQAATIIDWLAEITIIGLDE